MTKDDLIFYTILFGTITFIAYLAWTAYKQLK